MKYLKYLSAAALCMMSLTSCSDFLDAENKSTGDNNAEDYFSKNPDVLLPTAYESLRNFGVQVNIHEYGSDLYMSPKAEGDPDYAKFLNNAEDGTVKSYYSNGYKTIQYANALIHYGGEGTSYAYEGRFLRGLIYYLLTQQFGAVPYVTNYIQDASRDYPRTPLAEIYDETIADLEDLYANSSIPAASHEGKASKQAVAALLAKLYLAKAWDIETELVDAAKGDYKVNSTESFKKAASWSETAISGIQLTMSYEDKWSPFNEGNAEEIFSIQYERNGVPTDPSSTGHGLQNAYSAYFGDCKTTSLKPTKGGSDMTSFKAMRLWEKGDLRFEATFMTTNYNAKRISNEMSEWGTQGYYAFYNAAPADLAKMPISMKIFPYYMTDAECEAWLDAHKAQTVKGGPMDPNDPKNVNTEYGNNNPFAVRLDNSEYITRWDFKTDGTYTKNSKVILTAFLASGGGFQGMCVKKFDDPATPQATASNGFRDIVLFHVSQMYLVNAEANYMAGNEGAALSKINAVRGRAGLPALASFAAYAPQYIVTPNFVEKPLDLILDEYARECYAEQTRYADLRRTKQYIRYNLEFNRNINTLADMQNNKGEYKWYRPIPADEFNSNTALTPEDQNPGY